MASNVNTMNKIKMDISLISTDTAVGLSKKMIGITMKENTPWLKQVKNI